LVSRVKGDKTNLINLDLVTIIIIFEQIKEDMILLLDKTNISSFFIPLILIINIILLNNNIVGLRK